MWLNMEKSENKSSDISSVDMDVEEIVLSAPAPNAPNAVITTSTSPLLSSLLKSPTTTTAPTTLPAVNTNSARATAPTITTLLTSGSIPISNQPAITLNPNFSPSKLLTRQAPAQQTLLSPSQSAPTLSMLLEKNKNNAVTVETNAEQNVAAANSTTQNTSNEIDTMEIEDSNSKFSPAVDSDDQNEEQQLMEVFKNIGNIDELGDIDVSAVIDEEVDFLKGVDEDVEDEELIAATANALAFDEPLDLETASENEVAPNTAENPETKNEEISSASVRKPESSDDSNDNLPLSAVASLESHNKDRSVFTEINNSSSNSQDVDFLKEKVESAAKNDKEVIDKTNQDEISTLNSPEIAAETNEQSPPETIEEMPQETTDTTVELNDLKSPTQQSENSDVIVIPDDDDMETVNIDKTKTEEKVNDEDNLMNENDKDKKGNIMFLINIIYFLKSCLYKWIQS